MLKRSRKLLAYCSFVIGHCSFSLLHAAPGLSVNGNQLLLDGHPVTLRGVAVGDPTLARQGRPLSDYERIAHDWQAALVRIDVHPSLWKHGNHEQVLRTLSDNLKAAEQQGLCVIIDWHVIGWPNGYYEPPQSSWDEDPRDLYDSGFALAKDFWTTIATHYGNDRRVMFELWNEPVRQRDYGDDPPAAWDKLRPWMQQLVDAIRPHAQNVILATSNSWAYDLRGIRQSPLTGSNIAYAWHIYAGMDDNDETAWARSLDGLDKVAPVIVTEWGFQPKTKEEFRGTAKSFGNKFVRDFLDARNLSNTAWCWHNDWTPNLLENDWKTPTTYGQFVLGYLTRHAAKGNP